MPHVVDRRSPFLIRGDAAEIKDRRRRRRRLRRNKRRDEEYIALFLDKVIVNGVQDPGLTPFKEFLPRSAPLVYFLSIGIHSGAGWKFPSENTIHGIQKI